MLTVGDQQLPLASIGKRIGALIVDALVIAAASYGLLMVLFVVAAIVAVDETDPGGGFSVSTEAWIVIGAGITLAATLTGWLFDAFGWSPGKAATGIRTVRLDGRRPGVVHGLVRYSMRGPSLAVFGLGYLWSFWDDRRQTWHDKLADTAVVRARPLAEQFPDRSADPLVTHGRMWGLALVGTVLLTAGLAANVWWSSTFDNQIFEDPYYEPYRTNDSPRIHRSPEVSVEGTWFPIIEIEERRSPAA